MFQEIVDKELIKFVYQIVFENFGQELNYDSQIFRVFAISEGIYLFSICNENTDNRNLVVKLDKLNPVKNTLITSPKAVEILSAYEFYQRRIGPELFCVFKNGRIEEWIDGQPLVYHQFNNDKQLRKLVAECIATINSIEDIKCEKNENFLSNKVNILLKLILEAESGSNYLSIYNLANINLYRNKSRVDGQNEPANRNDKKNEREIFDLDNEYEFLTKSLKILNSDKIVFSHNDLSQTNIYRRINSTATEQIYVLNYDLTGYNYRGYDLANFLNNIAFDFSNPPTNISQLNWIDDQKIKKFLSDYLNKLNESEPADLDRLNKEVKFFRIYSAFLSILISILTILSIGSNNTSNLVGLEIFFLVFAREYFKSNKFIFLCIEIFEITCRVLPEIKKRFFAILLGIFVSMSQLSFIKNLK